MIDEIEEKSGFIFLQQNFENVVKVIRDTKITIKNLLQFKKSLPGFIQKPNTIHQSKIIK
jgi:hypothetical protein